MKTNKGLKEKEAQEKLLEDYCFATNQLQDISLRVKAAIFELNQHNYESARGLLFQALGETDNSVPGTKGWGTKG